MTKRLLATALLLLAAACGPSDQELSDAQAKALSLSVTEQTAIKLQEICDKTKILLERAGKNVGSPYIEACVSARETREEFAGKREEARRWCKNHRKACEQERFTP